LENNLRELRKEKKLTLPQLSKELNEYANLKISPDALSKYERGEREPRLEIWRKIAEYFHVSVAYLMGLVQLVSISDILSYASETYLYDTEVKNVIDQFAELSKEETPDFFINPNHEFLENLELSEEDFKKIKKNVSIIILPIAPHIQKSLAQFSIFDIQTLYKMSYSECDYLGFKIVHAVISIECKLLEAKNKNFQDNIFPVNDSFPQYNEINALLDEFNQLLYLIDSAEKHSENKNLNFVSYLHTSRATSAVIYGQAIMERLRQTIEQVKSTSGKNFPSK
jgi:transcriptional regulator with XRE-family HTH domain